MSRLTEKREKPLTTKWEDVPTSYYKIKGDDTGVAISEIERLNKLGKLEDLEEQIGCPLEVVIMALTNGVYVIDEETKEIQWILRGLYTFTRDGSTEAGFCDERGWRKKVNVAGIEFTPMYFWKDYKKTWWLKEDKSE